MRNDLFMTLQAAGIPTRKIPAHPQYGRFYRDGAAWFKMLTPDIAIFGNWATDTKGTWFADDLPTDPMAVAERKRLIQLEQQRNQRELVKQWQEAAIRARSMWFDIATNPDLMHPYLVKKRLKPYGLKQINDVLLVPVFSLADGKIMSLQRIYPNKLPCGTDKKFLERGNSKGYFAARQYKPDEPIIISEGWGTSQSLAQQWGVKGWHICAFNAGNLLAVAKAMRQRHPYATITIAADNDVSGVGQIAATQAAKAIGATVSMPEFTADERARFGKVSDWQDRWHIDQRNIKEVSRYAD